MYGYLDVFEYPFNVGDSSHDISCSRSVVNVLRLQKLFFSKKWEGDTPPSPLAPMAPAASHLTTGMPGCVLAEI